MNRLVAAVLAAVLILLARSSESRAQDVLIQGTGVKLGEATVFHPRVGAEGGVVTNVFYEEAEPNLSPIVRLMFGFDIMPSGEDRLGSDESGSATIRFKAGADLAYQEYLSSNERIQSQRNLDVDAHGNVTFNPDGKFAFDLGDRFVRSSRPTNFESSEQLVRDRNHFITEARWQPGGRMINVGLRYENVIDVFESDSTDFVDRIHHLIGLRGKWKFFPYSQVWIDGSLGFYGTLGDSQLAGMPFKIGSNPLRITTGLDTSITESTTVKLYAGYANGFYESGPSFNIVVGGADFGWRYMPVGRVVLGYSYDVTDSINANYYGEHRLHLGVNQQLADFYVTAGTGARFRGYRGVPEAIGGPDMSERDDFIYELHGRIAYLIGERFSLYVDASAQTVSTDFRDQNGDDPSFFRAEVLAGLAAAF